MTVLVAQLESLIGSGLETLKHDGLLVAGSHELVVAVSFHDGTEAANGCHRVRLGTLSQLLEEHIGLV